MVPTDIVLAVNSVPLTIGLSAYGVGQIAGVVILAAIIVYYIVRKKPIIRSKR